MPQEDFIDYTSGADHAGAKPMLEREWEYIKDCDSNFNHEQIKGIALSGGGIRSASFCLGVMQSLASRSRLDQFDYLSTVSGGGYLGGSLSWLWSDLWKSSDDSPDFGVDEDNFPYGGKGRRFKFDQAKGSVDEQEDNNRNQASLLRHLRQYGKYLTPGRGIDAFSFVSIILRSIVMGFVTLMALSGFAFSVLYVAQIIEPTVATSAVFRGLAVATLLGYLVFHLWYMINIARHKNKHDSESGYRKRRWFESKLPVFLKILLAVLSLSAVHWLQVKLSFYISIPEIGSLSAALGALLGSIGIDSRWRKILAWIPHKLQLILGAVLMIFGLFALADYFVVWLISSMGILHIVVTGLAAFLVIKLARFLPVNNISIHRYYRDRLMETFMPDVDKVLNNKEDGAAIKANEAEVHSLKRNCESQKKHKKTPYHLINTNIILVESEIAKFRGRGGDNFIISPLFSGSNATGWRNTAEFCNGRITLPTAVAISGAAANPDAGVAGKGLTTNVIISQLMSIFNLRLGYWATNPNPKYQSNQKKIPSYFDPGFVEVLKRSEMNEQSAFVQLSDGGHFENLALYELFRRRARLIIICDAGADPEYKFEDLANAIEKARVDFGATVNISKDDLQQLVPATKPGQNEMDYPVAEKSYLVADIDYKDGSEHKSKLIYIKTTLSKNLGADIHGYKRAHADFPDQTTVDQFFDEVQFEAYRELGWKICETMLDDPELQGIV